MNGKVILELLKKHWLIVVLSVVALAALPTAWFFAQSMNASMLEEFQKKVTTSYDSVNTTKANAKFGVPTVNGGKTLEITAPVNQAMIDRYDEIWKQVQGKTGAVSEKGLKFNQSDHKLLVEGLFPKPAEEGQSFLALKAREFVKAYMEFHPRILAEARAGMPPETASVLQQLNDHRQSVFDRIKAESGREPDAKELEVLAKELQDMRIARYRARATELGVYADVGVFEGVPTAVPDTAPTLARCWDWQERAWLHQDLLRAVTKANGQSSAGVPDAVVKRLLKVAVKSVPWDTATGAPSPAAFEPGDEKAPTDFSRSVTGRFSGPGSKNKWYDIRTMTVEAIISSQRIPEFIDALAATNFITVVGLNADRVEPNSDLRDGFYYGEDHVVRVTLALECVQMREWRKASMPDDVQKALGMVEGVEGAGGAAPTPPPPPRNPRPPVGGGAPAGGRPGGRGGQGADGG